MLLQSWDIAHCGLLILPNNIRADVLNQIGSAFDREALVTYGWIRNE